jgi:hypothetical protein
MPGSAAESVVASQRPGFDPLVLSDGQLVDTVLAEVDRLSTNESIRCSLVAVGRGTSTIFNEAFTFRGASGNKSSWIGQRVMQALGAGDTKAGKRNNNNSDILAKKQQKS